MTSAKLIVQHDALVSLSLALCITGQRTDALETSGKSAPAAARVNAFRRHALDVLYIRTCAAYIAVFIWEIGIFYMYTVDLEVFGGDERKG